MPPPPNVASLLARPRPLLLDGAIGTELARRGVPTTLPLWSAHALINDAGIAVLRAIHADYAGAGAEILVTDTFRTTLRALERAGRASEWQAINRRAVEAARAGARASSGPCLVAGGLAPLEDCYSPHLVPDEAVCLAEHRRQAALLLELGVDLLFVETMNRGREALAAVRAAREGGAEFLLSLCPAPPDLLMSGEPLFEVVPELVDSGGERLRAVLLNCAPPEQLETIYPRFARIAAGVPHGLYAHLGEPDEVVGWRLPERHDPERYAVWMTARMREGARLVGGCCGTTPDHIAALARAIDATGAASA
ncbi:MAG: homocysteine S-methyltransferase family protein [Candidatus Polarisedimenticolia bacterium]